MPQYIAPTTHTAKLSTSNDTLGPTLRFMQCPDCEWNSTTGDSAAAHRKDPDATLRSHIERLDPRRCVEIDVVLYTDDEVAANVLSDMTASQPAVYWAITDLHGANGNVEAKLWGPRSQVNAVLRAGGYDEVK